MVVELVAAAVAGGLVYVLAAARIVKQYERALVFRLGRLRPGLREPGFTMIVPAVDRLQKVNLQIVTLPVPAQEGITRDNVTVRVDAVVYFRVVDPADAIVRVEDYRFAVAQMAQTSLRSIIGKSELDDLLSNREKLNQGLALMIDSPAVEWGVNIDRVEIKDVSLPETMKRSMARQAEATRDRRARVINADAELQASRKLAQAADAMADTPAALQLRLLQTVASVATEKNSTLVLPFPVELLRFLDRSQQTGEAGGARGPREVVAGEESAEHVLEPEDVEEVDVDAAVRAAGLGALEPGSGTRAPGAPGAGPAPGETEGPQGPEGAGEGGAPTELWSQDDSEFTSAPEPPESDTESER
ncbi:slipin family protein [Streptomyces sp. JJ36]|uniref:slipin family protein n=1 Tax=Streptomyces sp. JJ36 TaxID=2736645 RepID=UPI001F342EF8|nr:slipin family protein [Streptomyces sp. JJ36]MCF6522477.1 slipin family protein [Streptomyces sp. JJ36]